jgi:hypothetical protein
LEQTGEKVTDTQVIGSAAENTRKKCNITQRVERKEQKSKKTKGRRLTKNLVLLKKETNCTPASQKGWCVQILLYKQSAHIFFNQGAETRADDTGV